MKITSKDLKKEFKSEWKELRQIWLRNKEYVVPKLKDVEDITQQYICTLPVIPGFNECENFALYLHANVKKHIVEEGKLKLNWAFGDFICKKETMFFGTVIHTACICFCEEGFYFIEPLDQNKIVKANKDYKPFFINLM
jgi:hypothetical protein